MIFTFAFASRSTFSSLTSRCTTPFAWQYINPAHIWRNIRADSRSERRFRART
jgi:hypothetical protein